MFVNSSCVFWRDLGPSTIQKGTTLKNLQAFLNSFPRPLKTWNDTELLTDSIIPWFWLEIPPIDRQIKHAHKCKARFNFSVHPPSMTDHWTIAKLLFESHAPAGYQSCLHLISPFLPQRPPRWPCNDFRLPLSSFLCLKSLGLNNEEPVDYIWSPSCANFSFYFKIVWRYLREQHVRSEILGKTFGFLIVSSQNFRGIREILLSWGRRVLGNWNSVVHSKMCERGITHWNYSGIRCFMRINQKKKVAETFLRILLEINRLIWFYTVA
jgi:hypothetical protein